MRGLAAWLAIAVAASARAQGEPFELVLRDGSVQRATALTGDAAAGYEAQVAGTSRRIAAGDLIAVLGVPATDAALPAAHLAGGDVLRGALAGGDSGGTRVDLLSPVFGRVGIAIDRLAALAAPGVAAPLQFELPESVAEALFVRATVGYDVIAGALHQIGELGVRFQGGGSDAPRWYRLDEFAALRLREPVAREDKPTAALITRVGDRVGVVPGAWTRDGFACQLEGGIKVVVRPADLAGMALQRDVVHLSDVAPAKVDEAGFDGEAVHPFRRDRNALGGPLVTAGHSASKGLGVHARSRLAFRVPDGCAFFATRVGFDDSAATLGLLPRANVAVLVNDKVVFERQDLAPGQAPGNTGLCPVRGGDTVTLVVEPGAGRDLGDRVNWLVPMFLPGKGP
ncbi:MAG: NPCBM/NEW2 domain-containing protein [Luteolibacter sp.]